MKDDGKKSAVFSIRTLLKLLGAFCMILFFCPVFLVSCAGQNADFSAMEIAAGVEYAGRQIADPYPVVWICLLLPAAVLALLFFRKKLSARLCALAVFVLSSFDAAVWLVMRSSVMDRAEKAGCTFRTTVWYTVNLTALCVIILLSVLVVIKIFRLDPVAATDPPGGKKVRALHAAPQPVPPASRGKQTERRRTQPSRCCPRCGRKNKSGVRFCASCGARLR